MKSARLVSGVCAGEDTPVIVHRLWLAVDATLARAPCLFGDESVGRAQILQKSLVNA